MSGRSNASQSRPQTVSLPTATINSPSCVLNGSSGTTDGWRLPMGRGISPVTPYRAMAFSRMATWQSSIATSTNWPCPVRSRAASALKMPIAVKMPAMMSPIDVPTRVGVPSSGPVMLITPPIACTTPS